MYLTLTFLTHKNFNTKFIEHEIFLTQNLLNTKFFNTKNFNTKCI